MKRLIAKRPIQYMGRTYERGEQVPAQDSKMVAAWKSAGSAAWETQAETEDQSSVQADRGAAALDAALRLADFMHVCGVHITDDTGAFIGDEALTAQICALFAPAPPGDHSEAASGHPTIEELGRMNKDELIAWAEKIDVDISTAKNNAERVAMLAAASAQGSEDTNEGTR